ncbi:MAG: helix-turn-helix domain-containing protein [Velocimicrobium sp.]
MYCVYIYEARETDNLVDNSGVNGFIKDLNIGEDNIFTDTSKDRDNLKVLVECMDSEDCLVVRSVTDLTDNSRYLMGILQVLQESQVTLLSILEPFLNGKDYYNALKGNIEIHKYYLNKKRTEGYEEAKKAGLVGRPAKTEEIQNALRLYHTKAFSINEIEKLSGVSSSTLYRYRKEKEE